MLSYVSGTSSVPLLGETIGANLERTVASHPDSEAIVSRHQGVRLTYAEFDNRVDVVARGLLDLGLEKGERVGLWSPNYVEWALVQYATAKLGVILVNLNPAYRTHELTYAVGQSGCRLVIAAPSFKTSDYAAMLAEVQPEVATLERTLLFWSPEWDALLTAGQSVPLDRLRAREAELDFDEPINIQYTSGTTGFPKGATLSHHNILNNGFLVGEGCALTDADRICVPVPYYHCFGMVMGNLGATSHGACVVLPEAAFDPTAVLDTVEAERCTALYGVPTMFIAELADPSFASKDLSSLRTGIMAGSPCPVEVMKRCISDMHMEQVTICYGMTETSPVSTQTSVDDPIDKRVGTVGRVHPHVEVKVVDPASGQTVAVGEPGELCTRGYSVMLGYWNDDERTAEAIDAARWMHTGDLATMDDAGYLNIVGRIKDLIIRGGENVYPREVEEFLYTHADVVDVQVIGVPDERYGEQIMAWVKRREGSPLTEEDIREFCRGRIAHFKVPRYVTFVDEFPMTVTGKVQKYKMREQAIADLGLQSAASITTA
jgi:fatty-acyl-CoA synthase